MNHFFPSFRGNLKVVHEEGREVGGEGAQTHKSFLSRYQAARVGQLSMTASSSLGL